MKKWKIALPILSLITLSYLAILTVKVFAHPKPEDVTDAEHVNFHLVERIERLEEKAQNLQNQITDLEADQRNEDEQDQEDRQDEAIADGASPIPYGPTIAKWIIREFKEQFSQCDGPCNAYGFESEYHKRTCKAGHDYWICAQPNMAWLHNACCPPGHTYRSDAGGVWRCMPNQPTSGSSSGSTNQHSNDPDDQ